MKVMIARAAPLVALLALAPAAPQAAAEPPAKPQRQCFWTNSVSGYTAVDDQTVNLRVGVKDVYQLELFGRCPDVNWTQHIVIRSRGSSMICSGLNAELITPTPIGPQTCQVKTVRKLTPEDVAALPAKQKP